MPPVNTPFIPAGLAQHTLDCDELVFAAFESEMDDAGPYIAGGNQFDRFVGQAPAVGPAMVIYFFLGYHRSSSFETWTLIKADKRGCFLVGQFNLFR
jgi:hypothetical protein